MQWHDVTWKILGGALRGQAKFFGVSGLPWHPPSSAPALLLCHYVKVFLTLHTWNVEEILQHFNVNDYTRNQNIIMDRQRMWKNGEGSRCCDQKARAATTQSVTLCEQATIEITRRDHSIIACSRHIYIGVALRSHSVRGESHIQRDANREVATEVYLNRLRKVRLNDKIYTQYILQLNFY